MLVITVSPTNAVYTVYFYCLLFWTFYELWESCVSVLFFNYLWMIHGWTFLCFGDICIAKYGDYQYTIWLNMMLLVGGVIPDLHTRWKPFRQSFVLFHIHLWTACFIYKMYLYYNLVCAYLACASVTYLNVYYTHIITCQSMQQYIRVWMWRRRFCDLLGNKTLFQCL